MSATVVAGAVVGVDVVVLAPALLPALGALLVLVGDAVLPGRRSWQPLVAAIVLLVAAGTALAAGLGPGGASARSLCLPSPDGACLWVGGPTTSALQAGILLATAAAVALLHDGGGGPRDTTVTTALLLTAATGGVGVAAARDIGTWLVTLELATVPLIALAALRGTRTAAHGALTLLVTSLTSFGLLALGVALWLTATGDAAFAADGVAAAWAEPAAPCRDRRRRRGPALRPGFQALARALPRVDPAGVLDRRPGHGDRARRGLEDRGGGRASRHRPGLRRSSGRATSVSVVLGVVGAASMLLGNVVALRQDDSTRLLAWSTVAQAGWVVLPVAAMTADGIGASAVYVLTYAVATVVAFAAVSVAGAGPLERTRGLLRRDPLAGGSLAFALLVLAGLPPGVIGLVAKVVALRPAVGAQLWPLTLVAVVAVVLGIAVYLRWFALLLAGPRAGPPQVEEEPPPATQEPTRAAGIRQRAGTAHPGARAVLVVGTAVLVLLSVLPGLLLGLVS